MYVVEGRSRWTVGGRKERSAGDALIVRAGEPHKFINCGDCLLRQVDIHLSPTFEPTWLED
jgi:mannose-6-phosphate isomerase-like protein (cupin superfamily)